MNTMMRIATISSLLLGASLNAVNFTYVGDGEVTVSLSHGDSVKATNMKKTFMGHGPVVMHVKHSSGKELKHELKNPGIPQTILFNKGTGKLTIQEDRTTTPAAAPAL